MLQTLLEILDYLALGERDLGPLYRAIDRTITQDEELIARTQALINSSRALLRKTEHLVEARW